MRLRQVASSSAGTARGNSYNVFNISRISVECDRGEAFTPTKTSKCVFVHHRFYGRDRLVVRDGKGGKVRPLRRCDRGSGGDAFMFVGLRYLMAVEEER